ncbi:hypothetical protein BTA51_17100 [Hahella sp. CCB-MM4]|uniref:hypothetical protein n=1 Tax=Hahella sp. (strain CCB-MM4) TaxID=1926491 RepID=UPI000B9A4C9F|nr:hypothetical protein [Hahella sp. CCB-MM4]OZG72085.1 hypothetical protein BTA51_17100 [Hahella sp. CCB-MM4]
MTSTLKFWSRDLVSITRLIGIWALLTASQSYAAIVNNNHLFQLSETMNQKVVALTKAKGKSVSDIDPPIFLDKLPIHLYAKSLDVYDQIKRLNPNSNLEDKELPFKTLRPKDVLDLLTEASDALDKELTNNNIDPATFEVERPLGKTAADAYQNLWLLTNRLAFLVPPPDLADTLQQVRRIEKEIRLIAENKGLKIPSASSVQVQDKTVRDVLLVMYQDMHLLGRLQRILGTEAIIPGSPRTGELQVTDIYDTARTTLADLHRMKTALSITSAAPAAEKPGAASLNDLYSQARVIHDLLLNLSSTAS